MRRYNTCVTSHIYHLSYPVHPRGLTSAVTSIIPVVILAAYRMGLPVPRTIYLSGGNICCTKHHFNRFRVTEIFRVQQPNAPVLCPAVLCYLMPLQISKCNLYGGERTTTIGKPTVLTETNRDLRAKLRTFSSQKDMVQALAEGQELTDLRDIDGVMMSAPDPPVGNVEQCCREVVITVALPVLFFCLFLFA